MVCISSNAILQLQRYLTLDTLKILVIFCIVLFAAFMFTGESENEGALPLHAVSRSYPYVSFLC